MVVDSPTKTSTLGKLKPTPSPYPPPRTKKLSGFPFLKIIIIITTNQCKVRPKGKEESMSPSSLIFYIPNIIHFLRLLSHLNFYLMCTISFPSKKKRLIRTFNPLLVYFRKRNNCVAFSLSWLIEMGRLSNYVFWFGLV